MTNTTTRTVATVEDRTIHARPFGDGTVELRLTLSNGDYVTLRQYVANNNDSLDPDYVTVQDCVDESENPVDYTDEEADAWAAAAMEMDNLWDEYEQAVFAAQRERAAEPDDGR